MQVDELLKPFPIKEFHPFPRAMLGPGAHEMIGPEALKLGFRKSLIMTSGLRGSDIIHKISESMKYHGLEVVIYDQVESNPKDYNVMDAVALYQENNCDSFVSIGGGSSHDACKGARISVAHDGRNVNDFKGFNKSENPKNPPHIAVSTTAGTGSETSWAYVITDTTTDPNNPHKYVAFDDASVATRRSTTRCCSTAARSTTRLNAGSTCWRTHPSPMSPGSISRRRWAMRSTQSS
jgi:methanol:N,N-dimethyl-4-nitrosoaniline oxidoreductase